MMHPRDHKEVELRSFISTGGEWKGSSGLVSAVEMALDDDLFERTGVRGERHEARIRIMLDRRGIGEV